jgi:hypothetical protein
MTEKALSKKIMAYLKGRPDIHPILITPGPFGSRGISDILLCKAGHFIAIELKVGKNKPTKLQERFIKQVKLHGGHAFVCRTLDEVIECLDHC